MSSYPEELTLEQSPLVSPLLRAWLRLQEWRLTGNLELWAYTALFICAALLRFVDLGSRALHHDESLHATYSYYYVTGKGYVHDPLMHGPFLFHVTALSYLLFGASDASSRFSSAFLGTALVLLPILLRPWLGRIGAFAAAVFLAISPSILYYSRFIRDDPYVVFFTLGTIACILRYRASQRDRWLWGIALLLCFSFASMEITYLISAGLLLYLEASAAQELSATIAERRGFSQDRRVLTFLALLPTAWLLVALWPFLRNLRARLRLDDMAASGTLLLVFGLLVAPQLAAASRIPLKWLGIDVTSARVHVINIIPNHPISRLAGKDVTDTMIFGAIIVIGLLLATFLAGIYWSWRRWLVIAAIFYVPYFLLFTSFFTNGQGLGSGIWGSLSYWLDQQDVRRGTQPAFYYAMTLPTYEYLAIALAFLGLVIHAIRRGVESSVLLLLAVALLPCIALVNAAWGNNATKPVVLAAILCAASAMSGDRLRRLLIFYFGCITFGLSIAGEKMPWLTEHPAMPLAILAGLTVNDVYHLLPSLMPRLRTLAWGAAAVLFVAAGGLALVLAKQGIGAGARAGAGALFMLVAAGTVLALYMVRFRREGGLRDRLPVLMPAGVLAVAAIAGFLGVLTLRADWRLNFGRSDTPDEMLIYTQSSPDIPKVKRQIDELAMESGKGKQLPILVDSNDAFTWPWAWYLRDYSRVSYVDVSGYLAPGASEGLRQFLPAGSVLLLNAQDAAIVNSFPGYFGPGEHYHHRWWFPEEGYRATTTSGFFKKVRSGSEFRRWWTYITNKDGITTPPSDLDTNPPHSTALSAATTLQQPGDGTQAIGSVDSIAYFPADWVPGKGLVASAAAPAAPAVKVSGSTLIIGGSAGGLSTMQGPTGVASDAAGNIYVVENGSGIVRKFDSTGNQLAATNPSSPALQFRQPWGIAVGKDGSVFVADTWQHRIVKLDPNLSFVTAWGTFGQGLSSPLAMYGPRSIAVGSDGNLWVTDTGNNRVIEFDPNGTPLGSFGDAGNGPGQFSEPVGIAVGPEGTFYVADTWNNRVQMFDRRFAYLGEFPVQWVDPATGAGEDQNNKPYLAVLPDNTLLVTFPGAARIVHLDQKGNVLASGTQLAGMESAVRRPLGAAAGPNGEILIADALLNEVVRAPVASLR